MSNPYYRVTVSARVRIHPRDMNNNISDNIKREAEKKYNHKCYMDYGYVDGIYRITEESMGVIQAEDPTSSGIYTVNMECRMLVPIPKEMIYATITGINEKMIVAETGQLKIVINESAINRDNIKYIKNAYYPIDANERPIGSPIKVGSPVVIRLLACKIVPNQPHIMSIGILESVVPPDDYDKVHTNKDEPVLTMEEIEAMRGRKLEQDTDNIMITTEDSEEENKREISREKNIEKGNAYEKGTNANNDTDDDEDTDSFEIYSDTTDDD
jgi:DNA-directed RNA polymerase subunit E'/Rpb7